MIQFPNPWEMAFSAFQTFLATFKRTVEEQQMAREAKLQLKVAKPPAIPQSTERRLVMRVVHNAPAMRPFLANNKSLTAASDHPFIGAAEEVAARGFVRNFHQAEHVLQRQMQIPFRTWSAPQSYRDELSRALTGNAELYQQVAGFDGASEPEQQAVVDRLVHELQRGEQQHLPAATQMQ